MIGRMSIDESERPYPGDELAFRVQGSPSREAFHSSGRLSVSDLERALALRGKTWSSFSRALDFGCGSGRIMLWLEPHSGDCEFHGVDIDERAIRWAQEHLPFARFEANQQAPPLPYPDGYFDLVFNHSVFTHIDEHHQDLWLAELRRITTPGATLLLTVNGEHAFRAYEGSLEAKGINPAPLRRDLDDHGHVFVNDDSWLGSALPDAYSNAYHAPWYLFEHWSRYFDIKAYLPQGALFFQDMLVLERPEGEVREPPAPRPGRASALTNEPLAGSAIDQVAALLTKGPDVDSSSRHPAAAAAVRGTVLRLIRHYAEHQKQVDWALVRAVQEAAGNPPLTAQVQTLREAISRQTERINRLEEEILDTLRDPPPPTG